MTSDEELMMAYQQGQVQAFETLMNRHKDGVYHFLFRFLKNREIVDEAFQEVFARVIQSIHSYSPTAKFTTWLYTIARNYCIDLARKNKLRKTTPLESLNHGEEDLNWEEKIASVAPGPDREAFAKKIVQYLEDILEKINPDQKEVFLLRETNGLPFDEIASIVGTSVNTVKSRMRYALCTIIQEFKKLGITDLE